MHHVRHSYSGRGRQGGTCHVILAAATLRLEVWGENALSGGLKRQTWCRRRWSSGVSATFYRLALYALV